MGIDLPSTPDLENEFIFDKYLISKEIMKPGAGHTLEAPENVVQRNVNTLNHWIEIWGFNMFLNAPLIAKDYAVDMHRRQALKNAGVEMAECTAARKDLCIIVGSGPSLERHLDDLRRWPGIIICAPTNALALLAHGVVPHYMLAVDSNPEIGLYTENIAQVPGAQAINLLLPTTADPETAAKWPFRRFWYMDFLQGGNGLNNPFNSFQCAIFPLISYYLTQAGSVVNCAIMLPMTWGDMGLADIKKVFLFGVDCGYPQGKSRVARYKYYSDRGEFDRHEAPPVAGVRSSPEVMSANGILTEDSQLGYKRSLLTVWWSFFYRAIEKVYVEGKENQRTYDCDAATRRPGMFHLYSCSEGILEDTLPHVDGLEVLRTSGACAPTYDRKYVDERYLNYLQNIAPLEGQGEQKPEEQAP